jgi:hypothetical protein
MAASLYPFEVQRKCLESFALREECEVFRVYCDDGISAYVFVEAVSNDK